MAKVSKELARIIIAAATAIGTALGELVGQMIADALRKTPKK